MQRFPGHRAAGVLAACLLACTPAGAQAASAKAKPKPGTTLQATIRWASHGIPHILARTWSGLGYGYGYALASEDICTVADSYVTVRAERSRYFGPNATWYFGGNGATQKNLNSDFFFQRINDTKVIEKLLDQAPPQGPRPEVRQIAQGYAAGYNRWLSDHGGADGITDPACKGKPWVKPISEIDVYRRFYELALLAGEGVAIDGIGAAQPPLAGLVPSIPGVTQAEQILMVRELKAKLPLGGIGSNAVALGSAGTRDGSGLLLGNPHFPWDGSERFFQSQLTIPGRIDVAGGSLLGVPLVLIGHTRSLAWSHTVSTAFRFTPYELKLVPGDPTSYLYDGKPTKMTTDVVTVDLGGGRTATRTLYSTRFGPMATSVLGLPLFPWTPVLAYAIKDANAANFRYLNHFFETDRAQSTGELLDVLERNQGIPWVNTIASDRRGKALYADISVVPNVPNDLETRCVDGALGAVAKQLIGLPILDGSTSACEWRNDPDAIQPGIFGPSHLPHLFRDDYVTNSNDSYWLSNPKQRLEGYAHIIGPEHTARSLRTRNGLTMVQARVDGTDGLGPKGFTLAQLRDMVFNNRQYAAVLWQKPLVAMCRAHPLMPSTTAGLVTVARACPVLAAFDGHDDLDAKGAILFRRFVEHVLASPVPLVSVINPFTVPFSNADPVNTPAGLDTANPLVQAALGDAVHDLVSAHIPLDATLRDYQYEKRGDERIPIPGGPDNDGDFNAINVTWTPGKGYINVPHGSSFVEAVQLPRNPKACPRSFSILTYSQSADPTSPYFADQTRMFSRKEWNPMRFCSSQLKKDPNLRVQRLTTPAR